LIRAHGNKIQQQGQRHLLSNITVPALR
jgi:hypothetical protein